MLPLVLVLAVASAGAVAPAFADDNHDIRCTQAAGATRMTEDAVRAKLAEAGYKVIRFKTDDGCYEVRATNQTGARVKLKVDPVSAQVLRTRMRD
jgi:hypothetical protein